jgi:predicted nucleic acid-binding protein
MIKPGRWVVDTSTYTHLARAGHLAILRDTALQGIILVPSQVQTEIDEGRDRYWGIPDPRSLTWVTVVVLDEEENDTLIEVKADMGGSPSEHIGECAVIAYSHHAGHTAVLDERAAVTQAEMLDVASVDTLDIVLLAWRTLFGEDKPAAERIVDDLLGTGMWLPVKAGRGLWAWAWTEGRLP